MEFHTIFIPFSVCKYGFTKYGDSVPVMARTTTIYKLLSYKLERITDGLIGLGAVWAKHT